MPKDDNYPLALQKGTVLSGQYVIEKVLGQGGFGITYKAIDYKNNNRPVAVKEYFPESIVYREVTKVMSYPGDRTENFEYGKKSFLLEAETLARFIGNNNIVRVFSYFEENGTAYFAMEYVDGIPFDKYLSSKGGRIGIEEAKSILIPVMDALGAVHAKGIIHRDVTPDNIYLSKDGRVMLLDFGAARYSLGDKSRSLDVVLKHGFAPKEQYSGRGKQGPYTDIYSLGATFYYAITGKRPPDSVDRLDSDNLIPPSVLGVAITPYQQTAILKALNVFPQDRYQSMAEFKSVLLNERIQPAVNNRLYIPSEINPVYSVSQQNVQNINPQSQINIQPQMSVRNINPQSQINIQPQTSVRNVNPQSQINIQPQTSVRNVNPQSQINIPENNFQKKPTIIANKAIAAGLIAICVVIGITVASLVLLSSGSGKRTAHGGGGGYYVPAKETSSSTASRFYNVSTASDIPVTSSVYPFTTTSTTSKSTPNPVTSQPISPSSNSKERVYMKKDLEIVGNLAANIKNFGYYTSVGSMKFWVDEDYHSLMSNIEGKQYILKNQEGAFSCLSYDNGLLYFVYDRQAYMININKGTDFELISDLRSYNKLDRFYVSKLFYFVYQEGKLYRINRESGKTEESLDISYGDEFTFYDGWIYYISKDENDNASVFRVSESDFTKFGDEYLFEKEGYFTSPVIADHYLYFFHVRENGSKTDLVKVLAGFSSDNEERWDVSKLVADNEFAYDLNVIGENVFFSVYNNSTDKSFLHHMVLEQDGKYDSAKVTDEVSCNPAVSIQNGDYKVDYMVYDSETKQHVNRFAVYDYNTNKKKNN